MEWLRSNGPNIRKNLLILISKKTADYWENVLNDHDVPAARVRDLYSMLDNDQPKRSPSSKHQRINVRSMTSPIAAFTYADNAPALNNHCAAHGEDTGVVLEELGYDKRAFAQLRRQGVV